MLGQELKVIETEGEYAWPAPNHRSISSFFGRRVSPTTGASSYHKGIDIAAPEGTEFIAVMDGKISFRDFLGGGGYTITLEANKEVEGKIQNIKVTYCHVSPNFIVSLGQDVVKGQVIGNVGPKYINPVKGNKYTDGTGKQTNGATTGPHLHLGVRINNNYINPLLLVKNE